MEKRWETIKIIDSSIYKKESSNAMFITKHTILGEQNNIAAENEKQL